LRWTLLPRFMPGVIAAITGFDRWKLEGHREILVKKGRVSKADWVSMNTDGPFCPLARVYGWSDSGALFRSFRDVRQEVWEFNVDHWPFFRALIPDWLAKGLGRRWGWHRMIYGVRP
jgi:hypothetical protein